MSGPTSRQSWVSSPSNSQYDDFGSLVHLLTGDCPDFRGVVIVTTKKKSFAAKMGLSPSAPQKGTGPSFRSTLVTPKGRTRRKLDQSPTRERLPTKKGVLRWTSKIIHRKQRFAERSGTGFRTMRRREAKHCPVEGSVARPRSVHPQTGERQQVSADQLPRNGPARDGWNHHRSR